MKKVITHETYGTIVYEESFWTGKAQIHVGGTPMEKTGKKSFVKQMDDGELRILVKGNFVSGVTMSINGTEEIQVVPKMKWYEIVFSLPIFMLIIIWGNSVPLCKIIPVMGGAIGGAISGGCFVC